jgi:hypothetical protein
MIVLFLITVAGKVSSFATVAVKAFFTFSILRCLGKSLVLVLILLMLWVQCKSKIAGLG